MPYMLVGTCVHKKNEDGTAGEEIKCHDTEEEAQAHLAALEINVEEIDNSLDDQLRAIRIAFEKLYAAPGLTYSQSFWVSDIFPTYVIVNREGVYYKVTYTQKGEEITFAPRDTWTEVELSYSTVAEMAQKSESDGEHPASHYLVVEDPQKPSTWHLRVRDVKGKLDMTLLGAAWAALHEGYRGNKYEGPDKDKALAKLKKLYKQMKKPTPDEQTTKEQGDPLTAGGSPRILIREFMVSEFRGHFPDVPLAPDVDLDQLTVDDPDPFFITLPIAEVNAVSTNGLLYDEELVDTIVEQINTNHLTGNHGHLKDEDRPFAFPVPDVYWLGAVRENTTAWAKGYLRPSEWREHYKIEKARGGRAATSIYGVSEERVPVRNGAAWRAKGLKLEKVDLAPPERAAQQLAGHFTVTSEMGVPSLVQTTYDVFTGSLLTRELELKDKELAMADKTQVLAELTLDDLKGHALFSTLRDAIIAEFQSTQQTENRVSELEKDVETKTARIAELEASMQAKDLLLAEFQSQRFIADLDAKIVEMTPWKTNGDAAADAKVQAVRGVMRQMSLAKLGTERTMDKAEETLAALMDGELKPVVEMTIAYLSGPAFTAPGKNNRPTDTPALDPKKVEEQYARISAG